MAQSDPAEVFRRDGDQLWRLADEAHEGDRFQFTREEVFSLAAKLRKAAELLDM